MGGTLSLGSGAPRDVRRERDRTVSASEGIDWKVARDVMVNVRFDAWWSLTHADVDGPRTARVEGATGGDRARRGDLADESNAASAGLINMRHGREQGLCVRVMGAVEHLASGADLDYLAEVQDSDPIRYVTNDPEIVRDEQVGDVVVTLEVHEEVEDRGLHAHIQR